MGRIPLPDGINPGRIQGDRLSMNAPDLSAPGRAMVGLGNAVGGLVEAWQANKDKMDRYNAGLAMEKFATQADISYQENLKNSAPDGTDFLQKQEAALMKAYEETSKSITNPEDQARFATVFERIRGNQVVRGMKDAQEKGKSYVVASTNDSVNEWVRSGALKDRNEYNDYFENSIKPRIDSVIDDPLERQRYYKLYGETLAENYFRQNPQATRPVYTGEGRAAYKARVRQLESGGNDAAVSPTGATGRYQFTRGTAKQYGLSDRLDPAQQEAAMDRLTEKNYQYLRSKLGREPSAGELYLAHQQGAGGAVALLTNPNARAVDVVTPQAVRVNGGNDSMTAAEFANKWISKFEGVSTAGSPTGYQPPPLPSGGVFDYVSPEQWDRYVRQGREDTAREIVIASKDELSSLEFNGEYSGRSLTEQDFVAAYGEDGLSKFEQYDEDRRIAEQKHAYQSMSSDQILADINSRTDAAPTGEGAANYISNLADLQKTAKEILNYRDQERAKYLTDVERRRVAATGRQIDIANTRAARFEAIQKEKAAAIVAANAALKERREDPASYVFKTNQGVRMAWREFNAADPSTGEAAIAATIAAQQAIGIPDDEIQPLPQAQADEVARIVTDPEKKVDQRFNTLLSTINATDNPDHQRAIMRQLVKSGVPDTAEVAVDAWARNDSGAARRVFEAASLKPEQVPNKAAPAPGFNDAINEAVFSDTGSLIYGFDYADPAGARMAARDAGLVKTMATLNMSRGQDQTTAIANAVKDVHGGIVRMDVEFDQGGGALGVVPPDVDQAELQKGMEAAYRTGVVPAVTNLAQRTMMDSPGVSGESKAVLDATMNYNLSDIMAEGRFRNYGDGWGFYDPYTNSFVPGMDGKPLVWTTDQLLTLSKFGDGGGGGF